MKKVDLLNDLAGRSFVYALSGNPIHNASYASGPLGEKLYNQAFIEIVGNTGQVRNINFMVVNESTVNEIAFYMNEDPTPMVRDAATIAYEAAVKEAQLKVQLGNEKPTKTEPTPVKLPK